MSECGKVIAWDTPQLGGVVWQPEGPSHGQACGDLLKQSELGGVGSQRSGKVIGLNLSVNQDGCFRAYEFVICPKKVREHVVHVHSGSSWQKPLNHTTPSFTPTVIV